MKEHKGLRFGLIAAAAVAVALIGGLLVAQVSAAAHRVDVHDAKAAVGEVATVDVGAHDMPEPGLGSWTIDVTYDSAIVSVVSCALEESIDCTVDVVAADTVRFVGFVVGDGLVGDTVLGSITFTCDAEGESALTIDPGTLDLNDATLGDPAPTGAAVDDGSITCNVAGTGTPDATEEPTITGPEDGTGPLGEGSNGVSGWLIAALAGAGFAALAGFGALRLRTRQ